jgi:hypothetical protein
MQQVRSTKGEKMKRLLAGSAVAGLFALAVPPAVGAAAATSQVAVGESLTLTAEIVSFDAATRKIVIRGPLGGRIDGVVSADVKDLSLIQPGAMVSATYYQAIAASVRRKGEAQPLFGAADAAARAQPEMAPEALASTSKALTVVSVDRANHMVVFQDAEGTLLPIDVLRPEFQAKLKDLKPGDQVDVTYSEALVTGITPVKPGEDAQVKLRAGTLVIDNGEIVKRLDDVLLIRNDRGRMVRVKVDSNFKFMIDGKERTVYDLKEGTKLTRTAIRVWEASYSD